MDCLDPTVRDDLRIKYLSSKNENEHGKSCGSHGILIFKRLKVVSEVVTVDEGD